MSAIIAMMEARVSVTWFNHSQEEQAGQSQSIINVIWLLGVMLVISHDHFCFSLSILSLECGLRYEIFTFLSQVNKIPCKGGGYVTELNKTVLIVSTNNYLVPNSSLGKTFFDEYFFYSSADKGFAFLRTP